MTAGGKRNKSGKNAFFSEVFNATIEDVVIHTKTEGKPVKEIKFAMEKVVDPDTNEITIVSRSSFVREVYDKDFNSLPESDLLALRGRRCEVLVYSNSWIIIPISKDTANV